jgi:hypothetical protein
MRPPKLARSRWPSAAASIDLPLPPGPTSATRVGRVVRIVRASVAISPLRPFMPTGRGGKIDRVTGFSARARAREERAINCAVCWPR